MTIHRTIRLLALALAALPFALAACGGSGTEAGGVAGTEVSGGGSAAASCAFIVRYDGHDYFGTAVHVTPAQGNSLGNGTFPPCNDTGGALPTSPAEEVEVAAIQGIPLSVAIMLPGRTDLVLVRDDVEKLPKELAPR